MTETPNLDAYLREKAAEHNDLLREVRALRRAVQAFLDCEGIPPTEQFQHAHRLALAVMRAVRREETP